MWRVWSLRSAAQGSPVVSTVPLGIPQPFRVGKPPSHSGPSCAIEVLDLYSIRKTAKGDRKACSHHLHPQEHYGEIEDEIPPGVLGREVSESSPMAFTSIVASNAYLDPHERGEPQARLDGAALGHSQQLEGCL